MSIDVLLFLNRFPLFYIDFLTIFISISIVFLQDAFSSPVPPFLGGVKEGGRGEAGRGESGMGESGRQGEGREAGRGEGRRQGGRREGGRGGGRGE